MNEFDLSNQILEIVWLLFGFCFLFSFFFLVIYSSRKTEVERMNTMEPLFQERCGVKGNKLIFPDFDFVLPCLVSWPLARHSIYIDKIIVNKFKSPVIVPKIDIKEVKVGHFLFMYRVEYILNKNTYPDNLIVLTWFPDLVKDALKKVDIKI